MITICLVNPLLIIVIIPDAPPSQNRKRKEKKKKKQLSYLKLCRRAKRCGDENP